MRSRCGLPAAAAVILAFTLPATAGSRFAQTDVFRAGEAGVHTYRIPSLFATKQGTLLAFAEARRGGQSDTGDIDLVLKRSEDGGKTWSALQTVWDDGPNVCGNPCPVQDRDTGTIWLLLTWNDGRDKEPEIIARTSRDRRLVFVCRSEDDGKTWSKPVEITEAVMRPEWTWYATGPGAGIQMEHGPHRGRLVIPCDHIEGETERYYSHVIYSDDHGRTWTLGGRVPKDGANECEVVETSGGGLLLNMRNHVPKGEPRPEGLSRQVARSADGGATWTDQQHDRALIEPICQASIRRLSWAEGARPGVILFSNPASTEKRERMTVRASRDDGRTWPVSRVIATGPSAYSSLAALPEGDAGLLYETGEKNAYERIVFARFNLEWLEEATGAARGE